MPSISQAVPLINSTVDASVCGKDALTDSYGWFVQVLLASLAFGLLICKYYTEFGPLYGKDPWVSEFYFTNISRLMLLVGFLYMLCCQTYFLI